MNAVPIPMPKSALPDDALVVHWKRAMKRHAEGKFVKEGLADTRLAIVEELLAWRAFRHKMAEAGKVAAIQ